MSEAALFLSQLISKVQGQEHLAVKLVWLEVCFIADSYSHVNSYVPFGTFCILVASAVYHPISRQFWMATRAIVHHQRYTSLERSSWWVFQLWWSFTVSPTCYNRVQLALASWIAPALFSSTIWDFVAFLGERTDTLRCKYHCIKLNWNRFILVKQFGHEDYLIQVGPTDWLQDMLPWVCLTERVQDRWAEQVGC